MSSPEFTIEISPKVARVWKAFPPLISVLLPHSEDAYTTSLSQEALIRKLIEGHTPNLLLPTEIGDWPEDQPLHSDLTPRTPISSGKFQRQIIDSLPPEQLCKSVGSHPDAIALKAGLLQLHDDLDASHRSSQSIEGRGRHQAGDYWHAIMHRREPDYSNSKYWFRHVGEHPIFPQLGQYSAGIATEFNHPQVTDWSQRLLQGKNDWNPMAFVDLAQTAARTPGPLQSFAQRLQRREMWLLLEATWQDAG